MIKKKEISDKVYNKIAYNNKKHLFSIFSYKPAKMDRFRIRTCFHLNTYSTSNLPNPEISHLCQDFVTKSTVHLKIQEFWSI